MSMKQAVRALCEDCKHFRPDRSWYWFLLFPIVGFPFGIRSARRGAHRFAKCARTSRYSLVSRRLWKDRDGAYCDIERKYDCGREARFFEPRRPR